MTAERDASVCGLVTAMLIAMVATLLAVSATPADAGDGVVAPQDPFLCTTEFSGLGQPVVDNQERRGTPVYPEDDNGQPDRDADPVGWSEDCQADDDVVSYHYRNDAGSLQELEPGVEELPEDIAWLDADDLVGAEAMELGGADEIPYLLRYERGTLPEQRFMWSIAMLVPFEEVVDTSETSHDHWNDRLLFSFGGGVGVGHSQGSLSTSGGTVDEAMQLGHAVVFTSGTVTSVHYNLLRGGLTAEEAKATFVERHGEPAYTVGIGGSGGGIQQYIYGQNNPGVIDAAIPQYAYPDMATQTIHIGDCELLGHYMDVTDADNPRWADWDERRTLIGLNSIEGFTSTWQDITEATGSDECIEGWRGATPLMMNPNFGLATEMDAVLEDYLPELLAKVGQGEPPVPDDFPDIGRLLRIGDDPVEWTHWDDAREVYGTDPDTGFARVPWDNVGVQYGLLAVADGTLDPAEFLDVNHEVGTWREPEDTGIESCGLVDVMLGGELALLAGMVGLCEGDHLDRHSAAQIRLSGEDGDPAPRREADLDAIHGAFAHGHVFQGEIPTQIPIIDARHYLEHELDMHNVHQSFAARERIVDAQGHHDNHLVWFLDARPSTDSDATVDLIQDGFRVVDDWMANIDAHPEGDVAASRPEQAVDTCWATDGSLIAAGDDVWDGAEELIATGQGAWDEAAPTEVNGGPVGDCAEHFPLHSTSRIVAGAPITGDVYKCQTLPVRRAIADGMYGDWRPGADERDHLEAIHHDGVCDYDLPGLGHPDTVPLDPADFGDIAGSVHRDAIERIADARITEGWDDGTFRPARDITRAQMATFIARAVGLAPLDDGPFSDIAGSPHEGAINALADAGLAQGYADGTFQPQAAISRQEMASFLVRALELTDGPRSSFPDVTGGTHHEAIELIAGQGIALGREDGRFRPAATVSRQQMASFVARGFLDD